MMSASTVLCLNHSSTRARSFIHSPRDSKFVGSHISTITSCLRHNPENSTAPTSSAPTHSPTTVAQGAAAVQACVQSSCFSEMGGCMADSACGNALMLASRGGLTPAATATLQQFSLSLLLAAFSCSNNNCGTSIVLDDLLATNGTTAASTAAAPTQQPE